MKSPALARLAAAYCLLAVAACASGRAANAFPANAAGPAPAKAYTVAEISVDDPDAYKAYVSAVGPIVEAFGGVYIVRAGATVPKEGAPPAGRIVIIEFPTMAAALAFYDSPEYQAILPLRLNAATSRAFIVEGRAP